MFEVWEQMESRKKIDSLIRDIREGVFLYGGIE